MPTSLAFLQVGHTPAPKGRGNEVRSLASLHLGRCVMSTAGLGVFERWGTQVPFALDICTGTSPGYRAPDVAAIEAAKRRKF